MNHLVALLDFDYDFELDKLDEKLSMHPLEEPAPTTSIDLFPLTDLMTA